MQEPHDVDKQQALATYGVNSTAYQQIQSIWKLNPVVEKHAKNSATTMNSRYGLIANIPIKCKGKDCPYYQTCTVDMVDLPNIIGSRCPIEVGALLARFENYCKEFEVTEDMTTDMGQIKELVDLEIMILRCDSKMAVSADFIEESLVDVTKQGISIYEKKVTPEAEYKLTLYERHDRILKNLNADRASKKEVLGTEDASKAASIIMRRMKEVAAKEGVAADEVLDATYCVENDEYVIEEEAYEKERAEVVKEE